MSLLSQIDDIKNQFFQDIQSISIDSISLDSLKIKYLGRKGLIVTLFSKLGSIDASDRPIVGEKLNSS